MSCHGWGLSRILSHARMLCVCGSVCVCCALCVAVHTSHLGRLKSKVDVDSRQTYAYTQARQICQPKRRAVVETRLLRVQLAVSVGGPSAAAGVAD